MKKKTFSRIGKVTLAALLVGTMQSPLAGFNAKAATTDSTVKLRFLETTDLHDNIMDYDYYQDAPTIEFGLDRTAQLIHQARADKPENSTLANYETNSMLFDAGDLLQGNPMADYVARVRGLTEDQTHPVFRAMKMLNYDAGIPGNHEFNYGLDFLNTALKHVPYNFVNANIYKDDHDNDPTNDKNYFTPYKIIDKVVKDENGQDQTIKVGVIGFAPPQIMQWDHDNLAGNVITKDIVETANKFVPQMKADGADVIVAIAHSGCDITQDGATEAENAVYSLSKVKGIDALLFGHSHVNFPGDAQFNGKDTIDNVNGHINGTAAMEAGFWGNNLGVMDLELQKVDGKWSVKNSKAALRPIFKTNADKTKTALVEPDQAIVNEVKAEHEGTLAYVRGKIGMTNAPLYSFFAQVQDDPTIQIVNNAQTDYVKKWIAKNNPELKDIPVLSAGAPFKAGGRSGASYYTNIPTGELSIKSANDLYLYPNTLKAVQVTGATVKEWLEMSAGQFYQVDPNKAEAQQIVNDTFPSYNFDVIDGVKYQIDITKAPRYDKNGVLINADSHRIVGLTMLDGTPIQDDQQFIVATNNYRAGGGGNFPGLKGGIAKVVVNSPDESRQVLINYIKDQGTVNPSADSNWKFAPVGGVAKLVFNSSPAAKQYANASANIDDVGSATDNSGFEVYSLDQKDYVNVQLLGINDLHGQLDYSTKVNNQPVGGIQYLAGYLKEREATNPNTLLVQAGDAVGASRPVSALLQDEPTIRFLNELGFDVGTIGNHEFDEGVTEMKRLIYGGEHAKTKDYNHGAFEGAAFPYVVANVVDEKTNDLILPPYVIKEVGGEKIGFIGVVTTETPSIVTPSGVAGVKFTDEVEAINKYTAELKGKGVKAIVVLAHDPGTSATDGSNPTGKVVDIAKAVDPEVDVIFGAHDHKYLNSTVNGKLLVQSFSYGTAFSDVTLAIDPTTHDIVKKKAEIVSTFQNPQHLDAKVKAELDAYQAYVAPITGQVVGKAADVITRTTNAAGESPMGNLIADGMKWATGTDFAFMNVGGVRDEIKKAGDITWGDLFAIQPFGNDIVTEKITGEQVRTLLNQQFAADRNRIMQIAGLSYTWTNNLPLGQKVLDIYLPDGKKIDPKATYSVTVNNFMADGGDGFTILKSGTERVTRMTDLDALVDYIKHLNGAPVSAKIENRIVIDTQAPAAPTVNELTEQSTSVTGTTESGAKVEVTVGGQVIGTATAGEDGKFAVEITKLALGTVVTVTATDLAGNKSEAASVTVADKTAPDAPVLSQVTDQSTSVAGTAEAGATVVVKAAGKVLGTVTAGENGKFAVKTAKLVAGTVVTATATDAAGNTSAVTSVKVKDVTKPNAPVVNKIVAYATVVTGKAEAGTVVRVYRWHTLIGQATVNSKGVYTVKIKYAYKTGTPLKFTATDAAGNISKTTTVPVVKK